jgi:hypothetical protein
MDLPSPLLGLYESRTPNHKALDLLSKHEKSQPLQLPKIHSTRASQEPTPSLLELDRLRRRNENQDPSAIYMSKISPSSKLKNHPLSKIDRYNQLNHYQPLVSDLINISSQAAIDMLIPDVIKITPIKQNYIH